MKNSMGEDAVMATISCEQFTNQPISYAMAYVAFQNWEKPYEVDVALSRGTIFPGLDKPFLGEEVIPRGK